MTHPMDAAPNDRYPETIVLRDGRDVVLRPLTPASRPLIVAAMAKLSPQTSRRRFFTVRYQLSDDELDRMTSLDGVSAFALGAAARGADGRPEGEGVAVARYARDVDDASTAELAILVVDAFQGFGLGRIMIERLVAEARSRGIEHLRARVLADNDVVIDLLRKHAPSVVIECEEDGLVARIPTDIEIPVVDTPIWM